MASSNRLDRACERSSSIHEEGERDSNTGSTEEVVAVAVVMEGEVTALVAAAAVVVLTPPPPERVEGSCL